MIAAAQQDAQPVKYKNAAEKKLAFLQRFSYGELDCFHLNYVAKGDECRGWTYIYLSMFCFWFLLLRRALFLSFRFIPIHSLHHLPPSPSA